MTEIKSNQQCLLVSADESARKTLGQMLNKNKLQAVCINSPAEAARFPDLNIFNTIFIDMDSGLRGMDLLQKVRKLGPAINVIIILDDELLYTAGQALKLGALSIITKPIKLPQASTVLELVNKDIVISRQRLATRHLTEKGIKFPLIIHNSPAMKNLMAKIEKVATSDTPVLLLGESGAGKDLIARTIHQQSRRSQSLFFAINCAGFTSTLLESELFGHEKGAFTGADKLQQGLFEVADGGTVFLDEIGDMSLEAQSKLLRILESGEFRRVGGNVNLYTDVRIIAATNLDFKTLVKTNRIRHDLYYRINTIALNIPPLRERVEDIKNLSEYFLEILGHDIGKKYSLDPDALAALESYSWPGNVRQLKNTIESLLLLTEGPVIRVADLPEWILLPQDPPPQKESDTLSLSESVKKTEIRQIAKTLAKTSGNRRNAARLLGLSEPTLYRKLKEYGLLNP
jgi:DNA-binding NtrC family response regulator